MGMLGVFATSCVGHHHDAVIDITWLFIANAAIEGRPMVSWPSLFFGQTRSLPLLKRNRSLILGSASHNLARELSSSPTVEPFGSGEDMAQVAAEYQPLKKK